MSAGSTPDQTPGGSAPPSSARPRIVPLGLRTANDFVDKYHRHSARTSNDGGKFAIGLELDGRLVGVAIVGRPVSRELQGKLFVGPLTAELLRCCTSPDAPKGAVSKLNARAKRIWQLMGGVRWITYTLQREGGEAMRGAGYDREAAVEGRDWNGDKNGDRPIACEDKWRWGNTLPEIPA
jgi:hypothetical protein